jgi:DeoR family transcriptional regulator of aga operon
LIDRRKRIADFVNDQGAISFRQLKEVFSDVSEMTLRNDLRTLDEERLIVRVHGGAKSVDRIIGTDDFLNKRFCRNVTQKQSIAKKAIDLLLPGTSVFLDSGSTLTEFAKVFPDQSHLVITSGIHCAMELAKLHDVKIFMLCGKLNPSSMSVSGSSCIEKISEMNFDIAFLGSTGYMKETGFNCGAEEENELKKTVLRRAETRVVLMDSTKVGINNTFSFASVRDVDFVVSDDLLDEKVKEYFQNNKIKVI